MVSYRNYKVGDFQFLRKMLFEAVFWSRSEDERPSLEEGLSYDYIKHVLEEFGSRDGDVAVIAVADDGTKLGGAFIRYWNDEKNLRGYISDRIPVLVIGVVKKHRRQGIASGLMDGIKSAAKENGISEISLCVTKSNVAYQLYVNSEFEVVEDIGDSFNMLWKAGEE